MAAYDNLLKQKDIRVAGAMLVYLDKNGEFPEIDLYHDLTDEFAVFCSALHCYQYFKLRKKDAREECISEDSIDHGGVNIHPERGCES